LNNNIPRYQCARIPFDAGRLSLSSADFPWNRATPIERFILADGSAPALRQTSARMFWNERGVFILYDCVDPCIWGTYKKDNEPIFDEEVVEVFFDPRPESDFYYEFEISPLNVRFAAIIQRPAAPLPEKIIKRLDCGKLITGVETDVALSDSAKRPKGWRALLGIPFELLERTAPPKAGDVWRGNLYRIDRRPPDEPDSPLFDEYSCWSPTYTEPAAFHRPERFGLIEFVE